MTISKIVTVFSHLFCLPGKLNESYFGPHGFHKIHIQHLSLGSTLSYLKWVASNMIISACIFSYSSNNQVKHLLSLIEIECVLPSLHLQVLPQTTAVNWVFDLCDGLSQCACYIKVNLMETQYGFSL